MLLLSELDQIRSSYYLQCAAEPCNWWSLASSEHPELGICLMGTTNPPFISGTWGRLHGKYWSRALSFATQRCTYSSSKVTVFKSLTQSDREINNLTVQSHRWRNLFVSLLRHFCIPNTIFQYSLIFTWEITSKSSDFKCKECWKKYII